MFCTLLFFIVLPNLLFVVKCCEKELNLRKYEYSQDCKVVNPIYFYSSYKENCYKCRVNVPHDMSLIPGGTYMIGTNEPHFLHDSESPERSIHINDFYIDKFEVSNAMFAKFVQATGYRTQAELFGDSFLFKFQLNEEQQRDFSHYRVIGSPWWYKVKGISWKHPNGTASTMSNLQMHPVVHVSWNDAVAYCKWVGKRLPTEEEWEIACRGGKNRKLYPWGNKLNPNKRHWLNIWQGTFPDINTMQDGYVTTCPVNEFRQNIYDLFNIVGNVWEWTNNKWSVTDNNTNAERVMKGGSFLCHKNSCYRYRCAARSRNTADSSTSNLGFRCAKT